MNIKWFLCIRNYEGILYTFMNTKKTFNSMRANYLRFICLLLMAIIETQNVSAQSKDFYQLKIYRLKDDTQVTRVDSFLKNAYLPALHRMGIKKVGVFKLIANDTTMLKAMRVFKPSDNDVNKTRSIYVFIPLKSLQQFHDITNKLDNDATLANDGKSYFEAAYNDVPYQRIETVLLEAFPDHPKFEMTALKSAVKDRIYELRSYEGPTERKYASKVKMFNAGGEIPLFKRLEFNAVFYAAVLAGSHMPNLMYMTSFENMDARNAHWKAFVTSPEWKKLVAMPEYSNTISGAEVLLCHAAEYSDIY
jgi:hypothetical protein